MIFLLSPSATVLPLLCCVVETGQKNKKPAFHWKRQAEVNASSASVTPLPGLGRWLCVIRFHEFCLFGDTYLVL